MTMKERLLVDRTNRGLSQQGMADLIGVGVDVIRGIEATGKRPRLANALTIAGFYDLTVVEAWPIEDDAETPKAA